MGKGKVMNDKEQREYVVKVNQRNEFAQWLTDPVGNIGTGRSRTLALAYIANAMKYPDVLIIVRDHWPTEEADRRLLYEMAWLIREVYKVHYPPDGVSESETYAQDFTFTRDGIRYSKKWREAYRKEK